MNEAQVRQAQAALAFMAEKYRLMGGLADRFDDGEVAEIASRKERTARRLITTVAGNGFQDQDEATITKVALEGFCDSLNRQLQLVAQRGQVQDAELVEHRLREAYSALAVVESEIVGLSPPQHVAGTVEGVVAATSIGNVNV